MSSTTPGQTGVCGSRFDEEHPEFIEADNEHRISDSNGSYIVLGRDRPGDRCSGYGATPNSSRIDIVVGRNSCQGRPDLDYDGRVFNSRNERLYVDPSFENDAARIYISAKADIDSDEYLSLAEGKVGNSQARSAVAIKADAVRIVGREGIKLVTRSAAAWGSGPRNSRGGMIESVKGIDLIAGNDDADLQPLVKGERLKEFFEELMEWVGKLNGVVTTILLNQMKLNTAIQFHTHPVAGFLAVPSPELMGQAAALTPTFVYDGILSLMGHRVNGTFLKFNNLYPLGRNYILSRYNNTN